MSVFHQWLLADPASKASACAIILHGVDARNSTRLIIDVAEYLNEYDDDGDGRWLPATADLVAKISKDPNLRRLLGMEETGSDSPEEYRKTLTALGQRGHVVFQSPEPAADQLDLASTFHAGVGHGITGRCHVILDPELMGPKCVAHVIGDVFLEWLHCETRRNPSVRDMR